jgi:ferredoxin-thioredoxin reductase catalytic subunit
MKKRYWRCFVCNDIHVGLRPPEVCPTCQVPHAYVEITAREARTILAQAWDGPDFPPADFRKAIEAFADGQAFMVNPDREKVDGLIGGVLGNESRHGLKFCPCRLMTKEVEEDLKIVCPCNFLVHETYKGVDKGECWCGLFIKR